MRQEYAGELVESELAADWHTQFGLWFADAVAAPGLGEPNAMVLATADAEGRPSARTVLLKGFDERGFTFFTNYGSRKAAELAENPNASVVFPWYVLHRQVIACGPVRRVERAETEEYFATRPRGSQLGAWASPQSTVVESRDVVAHAWDELGQAYPGEVPAPPHWGGFRLSPRTVEFWQGRPSRLHDRLRFRLEAEAEGANGPVWTVERLAP